MRFPCYGDADELTLDQARQLLTALKSLAEVDPYFRSEDWQRHSAKGLTRTELKDEIERLISSKESNLHLKLLLLEAMRGSRLAAEITDDLQAVMMDTGRYFAERWGATDALISLPGDRDWSGIVEKLELMADHDSTRLAVDLLCHVDLSSISDGQIAKTVLTHTGLNARSAGQPEDQTSRVIGALFHLSNSLPIDRISGILDHLSHDVTGLYADADWEQRNEAADFAIHLIVRQLDHQIPNPVRMWRWLQPLETHGGYLREDRVKFATFLEAHPSFRLAVQRNVLFSHGEGGSLWERAFQLGNSEPALRPSADDARIFLGEIADKETRLDRDIENWQDLLRLARQKDGILPEIQAVAQRFSDNDPKLNSYLDEISTPISTDWEEKQRTRQRIREREQAERWTKHRKKVAQNEDAVRSGELPWILRLAKSYFGILSDSNRNLDPPERISEWLDPKLKEAALEGFEAVLHRHDLPNASEVVKSYVEERRWNIVYPLLAGLAERVRVGRDLEDLPLHVILLGAVSWQLESYLEQHGKFEKVGPRLEAIVLAEPTGLESYLRLLVEPQLESQRTHVTALYRMVRDPDWRTASTKLAAEWLVRFPNLVPIIEIELIDSIVAAGALDRLKVIAADRQKRIFRDFEHMLIWLAVDFLVKFDDVSQEITGIANVHPKFLWYLRNRLITEPHEQLLPVAVKQFAWIISEFRAVWTYVDHPGSSSGDTNPWDATDFLRRLIFAVAADTTEEAICALGQLRNAKRDSYSDIISHAAASQRKARREANFEPFTLHQLEAVLRERAPGSVVDMQAVILDVLDIVQSRLRGSDTDRMDVFYDDSGNPRDENTCRDRLVEWLEDLLPYGILRIPERLMPEHKRSDIAFAHGKIQLPVEIKGQWHPEVWDAATTQLDRHYTRDWRADARGIYIVLWFGPKVPTSKWLKAHPDGLPRPETAEALRHMLVRRLPEGRRNEIVVSVLDLSRPTLRGVA